MFDQFTGATITPRAVVSGVKSTLNYFNQHRGSIIPRPNACGKALSTAEVTTTSTTPTNEVANER